MLFDIFNELVKQIGRIHRARADLGVVLHGEHRAADVLHALDRAVVEVDIAHAGDLGIDRVADDRVAVVLAGDIGAVRVQILDRVVNAAVAVLELGCLCADGEA